MLRNWNEAIVKINDLLQLKFPANSEPAKTVKQILLVRALIHAETGQTDKQNQDMTLYLKNFKEINKNAQGVVLVEPLSSKGRICNQFEPITFNFTKSKIKGAFDIQMRPSFSMPFIKPPNMIPNINEEVIQSEFNLKQIDAPMPEAPWNRQCPEIDNF